MRHDYSLIVGNIGEILRTCNGFDAMREYRRAIADSRAPHGRASCEPVTLMRDGEPWREYEPVTLHPGIVRTKATRIFWDAAKRMSDAGITVDTDSAYSTVSIDAPGQESIFMQGDEADSFIEECRKLWNRYPSLPMDVAELATAEPYTDLWS